MAIGDIAGDLATAFMTPAQRAAHALKGAGKQSSFDITNTPGVVGRASQQAPPLSLASLAPGGSAAASAAQAPAQPANLASFSPGGTATGPASTTPDKPLSLASLSSGGAPAAPQPADAPLNLASAGPRQTSFDQTNLPPKYASPQSLSSLAPTGVLPTATSQQYPAPAQQRAIDLRSMGLGDTPLPAPIASLDQAFRPTGIGQGSNAIAGRLGTGGTAEFSNTKLDLASAAGLTPLNTAPQQPGRPASLADIMPGSGAAPSMNADFASLGSAKNLGDGIGTFSQAALGDAALSLARFGRANDIRRAGRDQDRADLANARLAQADQLTVVGDSSQPVTRRDVLNAQNDQQKRQNLADAATGAQGVIDTRRQGQAADQQQRQALRLEDIMTAAQSPYATPEQKAAAVRATDPDGSKAAALQLTQAKIAETNASAAKLRNEASGAGGPKLTEGQSKDLQYYSRGNAANRELASNGAALTGTLDSFIRSIPVIGQSAVGNSLVSNDRQLAEQSGSEFVNAILRKDSGAALTPDEVANYGKTYLPQSGDGEPVLKQKQEARTRAMQGIRDGLGSASILAAEVNRPEYKSAVSAAQPRPPTSAPAVGTVQQGYVFLGGDPASQASWRAQ